MLSGEVLAASGIQTGLPGIDLDSALVDSHFIRRSREYVLSLGTQALNANQFWDILYQTAPNTAFDKPYGVVGDWKEPDGTTGDAERRHQRHIRLLGWNYLNFMPARRDFIALTEATSRKSLDENFVRPVTSEDELAQFAAAYIVSLRDTAKITGALNKARLDDSVKSTLRGTVMPFFTLARAYDMSYHISQTTRDQDYLTEFAIAVKSALLTMPPDVTESIIQSTLAPEPTLLHPGSRFQIDQENPSARQSIYPGVYFTSRYCLQAQRDEDGGITAIPLARADYTFRSIHWYIPPNSNFRDFRLRDGSTGQAAKLIDPLETRPIRNSIDYAVLKSSLTPAKGSPEIRPEIRWRTDQVTGERQFVLVETSVQTSTNKLIRSGLFGLLLAATLQPDITAHWPDVMFDQGMGVAQLPVLALIQSKDVANSRLLKIAESMAAH